MADPVKRADEIPRLIAALARAERSFARATAQRMGIAAIDLYALGDLLSGDPVGPVELGRRLGLGSAAATGLADRLEAAGHVTREPHPSDRRFALIPTSDAREQLLGALAALDHDTRELTNQFDARERDTVARFLTAAVALYNQHATQR